MHATFRQYTPADYLRVRDFLSATFPTLGETHNWDITRWNFSLHVGAVMHDREDAFTATAGLWEDAAGAIVAVAHCEGEGKGEAYFQLATADPSSELMDELFAHAEARLAKPIEAGRFLHLVLPETGPLPAMAAARGYTRSEHSESTAVIDSALGETMPLPTGLRYVDGRDYSSDDLALAHGRAFGYLDTPYREPGRRGMAKLRRAPDYRPESAMAIANEEGDLVSFALMWLDEKNRTGVVEPAGTIPEFRRMGLGRAAILEGLRRIREAGALQAMVGSSQQFYYDIGFRPYCRMGIWNKTL